MNCIFFTLLKTYSMVDRVGPLGDRITLLFVPSNKSTCSTAILVWIKSVSLNISDFMWRCSPMYKAVILPAIAKPRQTQLVWTFPPCSPYTPQFQLSLPHTLLSTASLDSAISNVMLSFIMESVYSDTLSPERWQTRTISLASLWLWRNKKRKSVCLFVCRFYLQLVSAFGSWQKHVI